MRQKSMGKVIILCVCLLVGNVLSPVVRIDLS